MHEGQLQSWPFVYSFISACNFVSLCKSDVFPDFARQRILARLLTNGEVRAVGIHEAVALQRLAYTSLVVQDRREIGVRGLFVKEERQSFALTLDAAVELGIGLQISRAGRLFRA
jgi:hypothetical protein